MATMAEAANVETEEQNHKNNESKTREAQVLSRQGNYSLLCLSESNCLRRAARVVVESRYPLI